MAVLTLGLAASAWAQEDASAGTAKKGHSLAGHLLVAAPKMADPRFVHTVIYMVEHNADGAMGLVINRVIGRGPIAEFLKGFGIDAKPGLGAIDLHYGGPVDRRRGLILHTGDYQDETTRVVDDTFAMTAELGVLRAMGRGEGPRRLLFALGYSGWAPGQLENEMARDDWVLAPADEELIFDEDVASKWERAMAKIKVPL
jgi:putative transcriptional regulator